MSDSTFDPHSFGGLSETSLSAVPAAPFPPAGTRQQRDAAAHALLVLAQEGGEGCQRTLASAGAIPALARLLKDGARRRPHSSISPSVAGMYCPCISLPAFRSRSRGRGNNVAHACLVAPAGSSAGRATASQALVTLAANPELRKEADKARATPAECSVM